MVRRVTGVDNWVVMFSLPIYDMMMMWGSNTETSRRHKQFVICAFYLGDSFYTDTERQTSHQGPGSIKSYVTETYTTL